MALHEVKKGSDYAVSIEMDKTLSSYVGIRVYIYKNGAPLEALGKFSSTVEAGFAPIVVNGTQTFSCYVSSTVTNTAKEGRYRIVIETKELDANTSTGNWTTILSSDLLSIIAV